MLLFYSLALALVIILGAPYWLFRMATSGKYREGLGERLGFVPKRLISRFSGPIIWVHAVSVGELLAATRMIEDLKRTLPGWRIVVSTTTRTGQTLARERFGVENVFYFPLDFAFAVRAYVRRLKPRLLVLMETEFWPRLLFECNRSGVHVAVVNARISDRSWPRYLRLRFLWKRLLGSLRIVLAQSESDVDRLRTIGAANVRYGGNLKYDIHVADPAAVTQALAQRIVAGSKVLVCGSTLEGEETILLDAVPSDVLLILAPRHPERFDSVKRLLESCDKPWVQRTQWMNAQTPLSAPTIFLLDSIGELASIYSLATVAFVGGSLVSGGGHNPLEAAQFRVPVVMGPNYQNFRTIVDVLRAQDAIRIVQPTEIGNELNVLLSDELATKAIGERAHAVFSAEAGATARAVDALTEIVSERP
ncbi:3-deoxy-D-manno-octulosonic acid transferase [Alloacidobacterium dinghuense]|uniref:3-deoxy-D-manno-octulosonic acid transferase n=1 Tax=Alloacidobacterium dinghuense TaxID=2763107 RepID=A0A7G8BL10_9BACT|nr:3-deoxy-D-manno-octulosonic acid transferase [Alloacidobacterium dinghuense]QNI33230.1 3-deoxy-D-manno-octulosonic acid transferase [Alloacidobacterium dinghuense]